jgi:predicted DNA-binding protein YlxM (UPF0122 family)
MIAHGMIGEQAEKIARMLESGHTIPEIADILDMTRQGVYWHVDRLKSLNVLVKYKWVVDEDQLARHLMLEGEETK